MSYWGNNYGVGGGPQAVVLRSCGRPGDSSASEGTEDSSEAREKSVLVTVIKGIRYRMAV